MLWQRWIKDERGANDLKVTFMTYKSQSIKEDSDVVDRLERLELSIFDKKQRRTVLAEAVSLDQYQTLINMNERDFGALMLKRL